jgi:hypothetical protein
MGGDSGTKPDFYFYFCYYVFFFSSYLGTGMGEKKVPNQILFFIFSFYFFLRSYLGTGMGGHSSTKPDFFKDALSHAQPGFFVFN